MTDPHDTMRDDVAAFALGGLAPEEAAAVERHLATCAECRALLAEYQEVSRLLPRGLPAAVPPPGARRELVARARSARSAVGAASTPRGLFQPRWRPVMLAAALAVILVGVTAWALLRDGGDDEPDPAEVVAELRQQDDVRVFALAGSEDAPDAVGQLIAQPDDDTAGLVVSGMPWLEEDRCYQLWFVKPDQSRVSGGIFWTDHDGGAIALVDIPADLSDFVAIGVTDEPYPGSEWPTGENVLRGELQS